VYTILALGAKARKVQCRAGWLLGFGEKTEFLHSPPVGAISSGHHGLISCALICMKVPALHRHG
jgi:hypothetical protein